MKHNTLKTKELENNPFINLAIDTISIKKQAIIFVNTKSSAEKTAEEIAERIKFSGKSDAEIKEGDLLASEVLKALPNPTKQCERLAKCVRKGVAFHHAGLVYRQRELIEDSFREGKIKIICSTPTLAYGVDLPAFRVIIKDLKRYTMHGMDWIPVLEYQQFCGRAGRPKYDNCGEAIAIAKTQNDVEKIRDQYIYGESESIYSKLAVEPVMRTYILSLVASGFVYTKKQLIDFFKKTFWAHQYKDMVKLVEIIERMLDLLEGFGFIIREEKIRKEEKNNKSNKNKGDKNKEKSDEGSKERSKYSNKKGTFLSAKEILENKKRKDDEIIEATILGKRVAQLYIDPLTAHHMILCIKRSNEKIVNDFSLLQMVSYTFEMRPLLRVKQGEEEDIVEKILDFESNLLTTEPSEYDFDYGFFLDSIKTALFFKEWIEEKNEEWLMEKFGIRPGEIRLKIEIADWLLYSAEEIARIIKMNKIIKDIIKVRIRVKYGVREELLPLLKFEGIGRARARKLYNNKIQNIEDVKKANVMALSQLVGKNIAISLKKQVGQDIGMEKVPEGKRKGQISLEEY